MLKLQETKMGLADAALGEGGGVKLHKLSVKELKDVSTQALHRGTCLTDASQLFGLSKPQHDPRNQSTLDDSFGQ